MEILDDHLRSRVLLLILDNCEHLVEASARLADALLQCSPGLCILATSRERLRLAGELTFSVHTLDLPDVSVPLSPESALEYEAVRLFHERATLHHPFFALTDQNCHAVAQVCQQLDGIPLAIELAAARVRVLPPEQLAARLQDRFRLLTGGDRTALPRQQTLRALIDWSYDLLDEQERTLLRRLSVFRGGWTLDAAEAVCADAGVECRVLSVEGENGSGAPTPNTQHPTPNT
jgi:predicted ATPase